MTIKVIVRVDDISDRSDFYVLKVWVLSNFPEIPISIYLNATHHNYRWRKKDWNLIKSMIIEFKWEIGGHTRHHPHLPKLATVKLKEEISENLKDIENGLKSVDLNYKVTSFAYPYGEFDARAKEVLKEHGIIHGLTYTDEEEYDNQLIVPNNNLFEIGISCNAKNDVSVWNKRFKYVYENGDLYILCLHTPLWNKNSNRSNLKRIFRSRSIKEFFISIRQFFKYFIKKSTLERWNDLKEHLDFIKNHSNVQFITYKDLIETEKL